MKLFLILTVIYAVCIHNVFTLERETFDAEVYAKKLDHTEPPVVPTVTEPETTPVSGDEGQVEFVTPVSPPRTQNTRCSELICDIKCRVNGCPISECLDNGRCRCYCPKSVDPVQAFFSSILTSHMEPGLRVHFGPSLFRRPMMPPSFPEMPEIADPMKEIQEAAETPFVVHSKIYSTVSQTCGSKQDCAEACHSCNVTNCVYGFCECSVCKRSQVDLESRQTNVVKTCQRARQCAQHCQGCSSVMCRYGVCECNMCKKTEEQPKVTPVTVETTTETSTTTTEATTVATEEVTATSETTPEPTTDAPSSTTVQAETEAFTTEQVEVRTGEPEVTTEVIRIKNNASSSHEELLGGKRECVPKKCNHSCWERQCRKFHCEGDRCVCDQCPHEVVVLSTDGKKQQEEGTEDQMEKNRYEIVF